MRKMVIEVPDQFVEVGKATAEGASRTELAAYGSVLKTV
jgi:hypothetical protein